MDSGESLSPEAAIQIWSEEVPLLTKRTLRPLSRIPSPTGSGPPCPPRRSCSPVFYTGELNNSNIDVDHHSWLFRPWLCHITLIIMGNHMSSEDRAQRAISDAINKQIEEDSRRFRKECKILLLGPPQPLVFFFRRRRPRTQPIVCLPLRFWRIWEIDGREADEDHTPKRVLARGAAFVSIYHL